MNPNTDPIPASAPSHLAALPPPDSDPLREANELRRELETAALRIRELEQTCSDLRGEWKQRHENPAALFIDTFDAGDLLTALGEEFRSVCSKVGEYQAKGTLTLTVSVKPYNSMLEFAAEVKSKPPLPEKHRGLYYLTPDGGISRNDPKQKEFDFKPGTSRGDRSAPSDTTPYGQHDEE